MILETSNFTR